MGKPKAPAPPDYAGAAREQGEANLNSALATNYLNQQDQVGPDGTIRYTYDGQGHTLPDGTYIPKATVTTTLSPEQQALYNQNNLLSRSLNDIAIKGIDYVGESAFKPSTLGNVPAPGSAPTPEQLQTSLGTGQPLERFNGDTNLNTSYDFSQASKMPNYSDFSGERDKITDAYMQRLQPYIDRDRAALNTKLANQGLNAGSEAYGTDQDIFNRGVNDQRIAALLAGDQQQQNLFSNAMGLRQQGVNEAVAQGNFGNQARQGMFSQGLARAGFNNDASNAMFGRDVTAGNFNNQARSTQFGQGLASAEFAQRARQQAIQEADYLRNQPLNMLNALRSGNQVSMPQFANTAGGATVAAAPIYNATQDQYAAALNKYNSQMQGWSSLVGGLTGIGSAFAGR